MKFLKKSIYALSLVSMMGLWSCSQDEMLQDGVQTPVGKTVPLTLTVNRGDAQTRTTVSENDEAGLNSVWKKGDVIGLYNSNGERVGELNLKDGEENRSSSVFEGTFTGDSGTYHLWYFGQPSEDGKTHIDFTAKKPRLTLPTSPMTEPGQLAEFDILSKAAEIVVSNDKAAVKEDVIMDPRMAMAKFTFKGLPEKKTGKLTISNNDASYSNLYTAGNINLTDHGIGAVAGVYKDYVLKDVSTDKDLYIAFIPGIEYKLGFTFEIDNKIYTYQFESSTKLQAGLYYNGGMNTEGNKVNGYELSFTEEEVDHSKNPLAKWAESNLVYNKSTKTSDFAGSESASGSLYQWGRNVGFADYKDARGAYKTTSDGYKYYNYYVIGEDRDGETHCGTKIVIDSYGYYVNDGFKNVTTENFLTEDCRESFVMDGSFDDYTGDYYDEYFGKDGNTWSERAKLCGYKASSPAPDQYKLPTIEDFKLIMPKDKSFSASNSSLAKAIKDYVELRDIDETCKYVITWSVSQSGLTINSLVVPYKFTSEEANALEWLSDKEVKSITLPFTGAIKGDHRSGRVDGSGSVNSFTDYIAGPIPFLGTTTKQLDANYGTKHAHALGYNFPSVDYAKSCFGAYWTEDGGIFMFTDSQFYSSIDNNLVITQGAKHNAYALRCIKK